MFCEDPKGSEAVCHDLCQAEAVLHSEIQLSLVFIFMSVRCMLNVRTRAGTDRVGGSTGWSSFVTDEWIRRGATTTAMLYRAV